MKRRVEPRFVYPGIGFRLGEDMHPPAVAEIFPVSLSAAEAISEGRQGSACEFSGMKAGDVVTGVNGVEIETTKDFSRQIKASPEHEAVDISLLRHGGDGNMQEVRTRIVPTLEEKEEDTEHASFSDGSSAVSSQTIPAESCGSPAAPVRLGGHL
eukprot:416187-Hanusia_phi.AAC.3